MINYTEKGNGKGKRSQIIILLSIILGVTIFGDLQDLNKENKSNIQLLSLPPPVQASVLDTSLASNNTPIGSDVTTEDI
jgi:hypothetical protein